MRFSIIVALIIQTGCAQEKPLNLPASEPTKAAPQVEIVQSTTAAPDLASKCADSDNFKSQIEELKQTVEQLEHEREYFERFDEAAKQLLTEVQYNNIYLQAEWNSTEIRNE